MSKFKVGDKVVEISTNEIGVVDRVQNHPSFGEMVYVKWELGGILWCNPEELEHTRVVEQQSLNVHVIEYQGRKYKLMEE